MLKQQQFNNLEQYVDVSCDLPIDTPILPVSVINIKDISLQDLFPILCERQFNFVDDDIEIDLTKTCVVKTDITVAYRSDDHQEQFKKDPLFEDYTKYEDISYDVEPVVLCHPAILREYTEKDVPAFAYNVDGMHRIMSAVEQGVTTLPAYIMIRRNDIPSLLSIEAKRNIFELGGKCTWFPRYQQISEVGLDGQRKQAPRYTEIYDFSMMEDNTVVDFGGNIGQACLEAYFCGAKQLVSLEYQADAVETAKAISKALGMDNITHSTIDFNKESFEQDVLDIIPEWDWTIFQAIYRTKEIQDIKKNFDFIVEHTKVGIIFEGNGDSGIDTQAFYNAIFAPYKFKSVEYLGLSENRPAFLIYK